MSIASPLIPISVNIGTQPETIGKTTNNTDNKANFSEEKTRSWGARIASFLSKPVKKLIHFCKPLGQKLIKLRTAVVISLIVATIGLCIGLSPLVGIGMLAMVGIGVACSVPLALSTPYVNELMCKKIPYHLQTGDIVFQEGFDKQAMAVKAATHSRWSHVGVVFEVDGEKYVLEAAGSVVITSLRSFFSRNPKGFYAMRLKDTSPLSEQKLKTAFDFGANQIGKDYSVDFSWDDEKAYCSGLIWKIFNKAFGIQLCQLKSLADYDLSAPDAATLFVERFQEKSLTRQMVAPSDLANSSFLIEV